MTLSSGNSPALPHRKFGGTDVRFSAIGMGGIVVMNAGQEHANRVVAEFIERGVNYFDVSPTYGNAEERLGPAIEPHRKNIFLACKTNQRQRAGAEAELKRSLERLRTDYLDLYQLHAITDLARDVDAVFTKDGAMEALVEAKKTGKVRYLGFSAHSTEAAFAAMDRYDFDSILFPVNFVCWLRGGFGPKIMEKARSKGVACLAIKTLARQRWTETTKKNSKFTKCWYEPLTNPREVELALRFTLSQPVTAAIPPGEESLFRMALDFAAKFKPLTATETEELRALAGTLTPIFQTT